MVCPYFFTMLQELFDRWAEIQKQYGGNETDRIAEELNILEALRISGCAEIPGEKSDVRTLLSDRHRKMEEALRKRKE